MEFTLTPDDAAALRHLASVEPGAARKWLQDRPEVARRMAEWPPEIRLEVCRILYRSFTDAQREAMRVRRRHGTDLLAQLSEG